MHTYQPSILGRVLGVDRDDRLRSMPRSVLKAGTATPPGES